jgi:predicted DCC family thiol-disulfide oxidoreductase YuxK
MTSIVLFDGVCNLCNGFVQFVIGRDPHGRFQFAALQSSTARHLIAQYGPLDPLPDAIVLVEGGRLYTRSTAALRVARQLVFPWRLAAIFLLVPRPLRDWAYALVARRRYRWFGRRETCMVPTPELRARFLE